MILLRDGEGAEAPGPHLRAAMLVTALTIMAFSLPILVAHPIQTHGIRIDLKEDPSFAAANGAFHRLDVTIEGRTILDGSECVSPMALRSGLEFLMVEGDAALELRPHPEVRYETFMEILEVVKRARVDHLHLRVEDGLVPAAGAGERRRVATRLSCAAAENSRLP